MELGSLLGRWHQWRQHWSHERGYAQVRPGCGDLSEDQLDHITMLVVEREYSALPQELQLAIQHIARAECMGVEVIINPRLGDRATRETLVERGLAEITRRLRNSGIIL